MFLLFENLKIRDIIYRYRYFKNLNPQLADDQVCRLVLKYRISKYYRLYLLRNNNEENVNNIIDEAFKSNMNLRGICLWTMEQENKKYNIIYSASDLVGYKKRMEDLEGRITHYLEIIPGT
jgi:hypothetical protein